MKRYEEIAAVFKKDRNFNKHLNSPYAKPNHWGIAELKRDISETKRQLEISTAKEVKERGLQRVKVGEMEITVEAVQLLESLNICTSWKSHTKTRRLSKINSFSFKKCKKKIKKIFYAVLLRMNSRSAFPCFCDFGMKESTQ